MTTASTSADNRHFTDLQQRLEPEWVRAQFDALTERARALGDDAPGWIELVEAWDELSSHIDTHHTRAHLAYQLDSTDDGAVAEYQRMNREIAPVVSDCTVELLRLVQDAPVGDALAERFGQAFVDRVRAECETEDPVNSQLRVELSDVGMRYVGIFAKGTFQWRGEEHPLSYFLKARVDPDRDERHAAFESYVAFSKRNEHELASIFDEMLALRGRMAHNLGYDSFTQMAYKQLWRFDYTPADVARLRESIHEHFVPLVTRMRREQAAALGTDLVHPADMAFDGAPEAELTVAVQQEPAAASRVFHDLHPQLGELFDRSVREGLMDLEARPGKATGAFVTELSDQRVPFVFLNSVGSAQDVSTLVHEFGHAFQGYLSAHIEPGLVRHPTLEACEIHSMGLESLVYPYMETFFGDQAERYRRAHVRESLEMVPYIAAVDEFQHALYPVGKSAPDAGERATLWRSLVERYMPGIDWDADPWFTGNRWMNQRHIYKSPFYYIDYGIAQIAAWQLWLDSLDDHEAALERYVHLCTLGGTKHLRALFVEGGLADPFDPDVVADVARRLEPHLQLRD